jgi:hypothetical protein
MKNAKTLNARTVLLALSALAILAAAWWSLSPACVQGQTSDVKRANDPEAIPNVWAQLNAQTRVIEETNKKLDKIIDLLGSGRIKVITVPEDKAAEADPKK